MFEAAFLRKRCFSDETWYNTFLLVRSGYVNSHNGRLGGTGLNGYAWSSRNSVNAHRIYRLTDLRFSNVLVEDQATQTWAEDRSFE